MNLLDVQRELTKRGELITSTNTGTKSETIAGEKLLNAGIRLLPQFKFGSWSFDYKVKGKPLLIEIDGKVHELQDKKQRDYEKERFAQIRGFRILRFTNKEAWNGNIVKEVQDMLGNLESSPTEIIIYKQSFVEQIAEWLVNIFRGNKDDEEKNPN